MTNIFNTTILYPHTTPSAHHGQADVHSETHITSPCSNEKKIKSKRKGFPQHQINPPGRKIIGLCASNKPSQPCLVTTPLLPPSSPCLGPRQGEAVGWACLLTNTPFHQVRALLMNNSRTSISSVEVPDKSQPLKWISRLTCLHRAGPPARPHPGRCPAPRHTARPRSPCSAPSWMEISG